MFFTNSQISKYLADNILMFIDLNGLDIKNCRGQSYDNAMNMSEIYSGVQTQIKKKYAHMQTKSEAKGILKTLYNLAIGILITDWADILQCFNKVNKIFQKITINIETVISMYNSLI